MIRSKRIQPLLIALGLALLVTSAFFVRLDNFNKSTAWSIDEIVYYRLGWQVTKGLEHYNTIPYGKELAARGRELPPYFFQPLFKHPPLFPLFVASSIELFGKGLASGVYVSLLFGVLMIPLTYLLGTIVFDRSVGFLSALVISVDPISIMTSQKVWMDTTIAFFAVLAIYWFVRGVISERYNYFYLAGIASGLAALTKYTGGLASVIFLAYAILYKRELFREKKFWAVIWVPVMMLTPWFIWNLNVYGNDYWFLQAELHSNPKHSSAFIRNVFLFTILGAALLRLCWKIKQDLFSRSPWAGSLVAGGVFVLIFHRPFFLSFQITHLPVTSWAGATFYNYPVGFYVMRLLEFSLIYVFAFASFFIPRHDMARGAWILRVGALVFLLFFTVWGAFQSRYIIGAIPLLIILGVKLLVDLFRQANSLRSVSARAALKSLVLLIVVMIFVKAYFINIFLAYPNDYCYY